ncbi:MAG: hypothetical protein AAF442_09435 [Pseudomonadota bacterium]
MKRCDLPNRRGCITTDMVYEGRKYLVSVGPVNEEGALSKLEIFAKGAKSGSTMEGVINACCILISLALQMGVPLSYLADRLGDESFAGALVKTIEALDG